jgi:putative sterol carrier protein
MSDAASLIEILEARAGALQRLGYRVRFDLTDTGESILLDATGPAATIAATAPETEADTVFSLSTTDLGRLIAGRLNPMLAFSTGRLRVEGSKGVAMKLAGMLDDA